MTSHPVVFHPVRKTQSEYFDGHANYVIEAQTDGRYDEDDRSYPADRVSTSICVIAGHVAFVCDEKREENKRRRK